MKRIHMRRRASAVNSLVDLAFILPVILPLFSK